MRFNYVLLCLLVFDEMQSNMIDTYRGNRKHTIHAVVNLRNSTFKFQLRTSTESKNRIPNNLNEDSGSLLVVGTQLPLKQWFFASHLDHGRNTMVSNTHRSHINLTNSLWRELIRKEEDSIDF